MVTIEFVHVPEGRTVEAGSFPFVQVTYDTVWVGREGETELAYRDAAGYWIYDGRQWTDFIVAPEVGQ